MSTLKADTIVAADGTSPVTLTKQSAAKAWVNIQGGGTPASQDSLNVASLTDSNTGEVFINFSNSSVIMILQNQCRGKLQAQQEQVYIIHSLLQQ